ncbi:hypothetical protein [Oceanobacter kriegii]|uniref:hypothetical protein n=1 Tax=Oceanobacter kriegii TaxID=64972 RepID=UPI000481C9C3|nr:hypothetical protein [Oceanobacter kriegii]
MHNYEFIFDWLNNNQGVLSVIIFIVTILIGWVSGIIGALRKKPKFKISTILGPTMVVTSTVPGFHNGLPKHKTAISLYLGISNVGSAPSQLKYAHVGYHWSTVRFSWNWLKYSVGWFWLKNQTAVLEDFQCQIGEGKVKFFPFLFQKSPVTGLGGNTYLLEGQSINGLVYFEQAESYGACFPKVKDGKTKLKIVLLDAEDRKHAKSVWVDVTSIEQAKQYNPAFGDTLSQLGS